MIQITQDVIAARATVETTSHSVYIWHFDVLVCRANVLRFRVSNSSA
jgi:hypothetical protein